jgi:hypothetical protein
MKKGSGPPSLFRLGSHRNDADLSLQSSKGGDACSLFKKRIYLNSTQNAIEKSP